jgi:DNA-binding NarL/FixJ family response regulator
MTERSADLRAGANGPRLRVAIIEDRDQIRLSLSSIIDEAPGFRCVAAWSTMEQALREIAAPLPDVTLVDLGLPGIDGIEGIKLLRERFPALVLLVLTVFADDRRIFDALCAGATGYLLKNTPRRKLLESLREAVDGGAPMSPQIARRVIALFREIRPPAQADHALTSHEVRVLRLLADGHNYKSAAAELGTSYSTVNYHLQQIYRKLQVHGKSEAVAKAMRQGLLK